jgi:hypothetical protein
MLPEHARPAKQRRQPPAPDNPLTALLRGAKGLDAARPSRGWLMRLLQAAEAAAGDETRK